MNAGFVCYSISISTFLYSPVIREQYAARNPISREPTVRLNDLAFAVHAVVLGILTYSQFWSGLWGFNVGRFQRVSRPVAGIFWGSLVAVSIVMLLVLTKGKDGGRDPSGWAWIDVVSLRAGPGYSNGPAEHLTDLHHWLRQTRRYRCQVHTSSVGQL